MNPDELTAELRDIKPAIEIPAEAAGMPPAAIATIIMVSLAILAVAAWLIRRRKATAQLDPATIALRELEETRPLIESTDAETYAIAVSDVLRLYIERRFRTNAVSQTSDEFLSVLADADLSPIREHRSALREFLTQCDLVKFARGNLEVEQRQALYQLAHNFISITAALRLESSEPAVIARASFPNSPHSSS